MASTPQEHLSVQASSSLAVAVDFKANGQVSRMRSHKGNMPSLPQTKYCSLCPAKFTRTTHLNRHLRSHTNERLHCCNACKSQFTRSDLLTRHKRTCGDHLNTNRSRRKSCQACAESKIKCDLQFPCSKCSSRGRQCVFINDPVISRNKKSQKVASSSAGSTSISNTSDVETPTKALPASLPNPLLTYANPDPFLSFASDTKYGGFPGSTSSDMPFVFDFSGSSESSPTSGNASPRSDTFELFLYSSDTTLDTTHELNTQLDTMLSVDTFEPFPEQSLSPCTSDSRASPSAALGDLTWPDGTNFPAELCVNGVLGFPQMFMSPPFGTPTTLGRSPDLFLPLEIIPQLSAISYGRSPVPELQHYLYLFFSEFAAQMPLIHASTWQLHDKPFFLVRVMQACGALFVKTSTATVFVDDTFNSTKEFLIQEFARNSGNVTEQTHLILAVVLLQTIEVFRQQSNHQTLSNIYLVMLVTMIRQSGLICQISSWNPPSLNDPALLDSAWREWADNETLKRALLLLYLYDCYQCIHLSQPSSFHPSEFTVNLPCDEAIWTAGNALEWFEVLQGPSLYVSIQSRLLGIDMQQALVSLGQTRIPSHPFSLNPFAPFVLIHSVLRDHGSHTTYRPLDGCSPRPKTLLDDMNVVMGGTQGNTFAAQCALHNWLQAWLKGPESSAFERGWDRPPFVCNALPFYWLAQISCMALHKDTCPDPDPGIGKTGHRFHLLRQWLGLIRGFMRRREKLPSHVWDELIKIRLQISREVNHGSDSDGLLAFSPYP